ncbi:selenium binding protein [Limosilactobacillus mucosae]|uniref:selenium binding protein n=1 Tax=Limosilactobacillus mucosae TaxID=97478 RepID=UPI0022E29C0C|nr:selenium binding protein [Limosilactobacillus mucosae]
MYENYTRQSLPERDYRELLGTALCVFNANNQFIIENILKISGDQHNWWELMDKTSGSILHKVMIEQYGDIVPENIIELFNILVEKRDRIVHSFQTTYSMDTEEQILATKDPKTDEQFIITREYMMDFIKENDKLNDMLYKLRDQLKEQREDCKVYRRS